MDKTSRYVKHGTCMPACHGSLVLRALSFYCVGARSGVMIMPIASLDGIYTSGIISLSRVGCEAAVTR